MVKYKIEETSDYKRCTSPDYNYAFDKRTGFFARWGSTPEHDPQFGPPEIADIEITTKCNGPGGVLCKACYKSNTSTGKNMSLNTFKNVFAVLPNTVTQIAFGADAQATSNPELFDIMQYSRNNGVIPNITVADVTDEIADKLVAVCGAVAVSRYEDKDICYNSVKKLTDRGLTQTNIHMLISEETFGQALQTVWDYKEDSRLSKLNAIVFLSLKQKGRGTSMTPLEKDKFEELLRIAFDAKVPIGFDSCTCHKFLDAIKLRPDKKMLEQLSEPCESTCFSAYINVDGDFFPCSFTEGIDKGGWTSGLNVLECNNFMDDIWENEKTNDFRKSLLSRGRHCPIFKI